MGPEQQLQERLQLISGRQRRVQLWAKLAAGWAATALLGLCVLLLERSIGWAFSFAARIVIILSLSVAIIIAIRVTRARPDCLALARLFEFRFPQLDGRLLIAIQQDSIASDQLNYYQQRVIDESLWQ